MNEANIFANESTPGPARIVMVNLCSCGSRCARVRVCVCVCVYVNARLRWYLKLRSSPLFGVVIERNRVDLKLIVNVN